MPVSVSAAIDHIGRREARLFAQYVMRDRVPDELIERYVVANRTLFSETGTGQTCPLLAFALRYPWSLPLLDAAAAFAARGSGLRSKLLVFVAILEASPYAVDQFMPAAPPPVVLLWRLGWHGLWVLAKLLAGLPLLLVVKRGAAWQR